MNHEMTTLIVTAADGVKFAVETHPNAIPYELAFASSRPSDELAKNEDFLRVDGATALTEAVTGDAPVAPEFVFEGPQLCNPKRPALCRAQARWKTAAVYSDGDEPEELQ